MSKRKATVVEVEDEDFNDGSNSEDEETYVPLPRHAADRVHFVPDESFTFTEDGRLRSTMNSVPTPASPPKKSKAALNPNVAPTPQPQAGLQDWETDFSEFDADYGIGIQKAARDPRASDDPNEQWVRLDREDFLDELVRGDGRGDSMHQVSCATEGCKKPEWHFRCRDCLYPSLYCKGCTTSIHQRMPLHHIEEWNGVSFKPRSIKSLDIRIQLGHPLGEVCPNRVVAHGDAFVIVGSHTIDEVGLDYCNCGHAASQPIQLLRMRLYPATGTAPRSAATFASLERFEHMSLESKCSAYEFYNSLARATDNTGEEPSRERYEEFLRMTRQWQHLHLLKRAGRAHSCDEHRMEDTKPGECALLCPACPQPEKNLPPDWEKVPFERGFLYALFLAIDANFRLKRKDVSSEEKDPGFGNGWAFFGEVKAYMAYLDKYWDDKQERSTCVAHDAVDKPDRESLGTASSGIGTVDCARHNMKRPNGVGDLQKGERYINMDWLFFMSLAGSTVYRLFVSYDIACQWHKNIWGRMSKFSTYQGVVFMEGQKYVTFLVPKFHLPAHIELCNILFSFNLTPFVGMTDGEAPERGWADANRLANSTSISGPGARRDALDAHFQYWNWKKIMSLGRTLLERMQKAAPMMLETRAAWVDIERSFTPTVIETWTAMAEVWERDPRKPNPFQSKVTHDSLKDVRLQLAIIASEDKMNERVLGDMHETEMLSMGLQLEEQQRALATHVGHVGLHETVDQGRRRIDRETKLRRKIDSWMLVQQLFIPEVTRLRERDDTARKRAAATQVLPGVRAQDMKLWLPSGIGRQAQCDASLVEFEYRLRKGQAFAALDEMCGLLALRTREYHHKDRGQHGVKLKTRSDTRIKGLQARISAAAEDYRAARSALVALGVMLKKTEWDIHLKVLAAGDVRGRPNAHFGDEERQRGGRKKRRVLTPEEEARKAAVNAEDKMPMSWIWLAQGAGDDEDVVNNDFLRIEWAKTRAKAMRYQEEVDLLEEEMRRVLQFQEWRTEWWRSLVGLRADLQPDAALREGHAAYAHKQAGYMEGIGTRFQAMWKDVPQFLEGIRATYDTMEDEEEEGGEGDEDGVGEGDDGGSWLES
ncbi:hypothetical protein DFH06DRAFT_1330093 [Mycena polygramma]|nr:hypothetical protein DFH06DRAFT_1330093 [Mycena polygramma]